MYRGRPPPRGSYPPLFEGRGPPPPRPYPAAGYRDDRNRPRPPYHPGYHDHGPPSPFRRSPPRRRYPSPGSDGHRGAEYRAGGPPRERSPSPRGPIPLDRNLVITVGNELTGPSGSSHRHDRDYPPRPDYERSRGRSRPRSWSRDQSPDRSRAKSRGRSKSRARSKSRPRSRSRSRSPDRSRARSRGRSKSHSPDRSRARSRGRSKSRPRSRSRSRSRSRGRSRGRSYGKAVSHGRSKSRQRSRSRSSSASSSSSSRSDSEEKSKKEFKELETARRRKELEEMLSQPTKSILKRRNDSEDSPLLKNTDSPRGLEGASISRVAEQLLQAVKGMEPHRVASMLSELQSDPQMAQRPGLDAEIREILTLLGGQAAGAKPGEKTPDDMDDEEKFLYGDSEEPKTPPASEPVRHHGLDLYGDVTEEALYGDYPPQKAVTAQTYGVPPGGTPHLQAPPTTSEVDVRYVGRPTVGLAQNITLQVSNPTYPPGTEPLEESERQALEEYEKIQDLLKTIGLDLGVAEISKMAARTKERLHGNKPPPKTPTRRRRFSSGSSDSSRHSRGCRRRSHSSSSSSSSSRSRSRGWGGSRRGSWSSDDGRRKSSTPPKSHKDRDIKDTKAEWSDVAPQMHKEPLLQQNPDQNTLPPHPGVPIPTYPPSQVSGMMPPNYPPPGYGQYANYLPYMHQQWPPMYPPPNLTMPPQTDEFPPTLPCKQLYSNAVPEAGAKGVAKSCVRDGEKGKVSSHDRRESEEQNNESQKQKVLEEREKLKQERDIRMKKKEYLMKELERLRKQQGELLRKKRREKGGHKDPLLQEISHLQEEVMTQISNLRKEHEAAEKKRNEIDKVALILGLSPSDRPRRNSKPLEEQKDGSLPPPPAEKETREAQRSPQRRQEAGNSVTKQTSEAPSLSRDKLLVCAPAPPPTPPPEQFEYYDAGNHWCKNCNVTSGSMFDFFTHLHSKTHRKTLDPYDRPWASTPTKTIKNTLSEDKLTKPAKGSEFLLPVRGFFCLLCKEFYGDAICAEEHVTTHAHNEKYKKQMYENPLYEQRRNLDRQAGLTLETSAKKRKHEDDEKGNKEKEDKSKHKKEKKEKEKKKEDNDAVQKEEKSKVKKEEEEKVKLSRKEQDLKDGDEKYKHNKKDDKYWHSREDEARAKYSRRDEDDRYKYSREEEHRYNHRKDEEPDRPDNCSKYGQRGDEDKHKYSKYSDSRSKHDRERDEGKPKADKEAFNMLDQGKPAGKPAASKPEPPPKPCDPPKILCGPSPAMRAKLRKQSLEAGKAAPGAMTASFGKFTWKKRENILAKEAQKVAAEFIKDDEAAVKQPPVSVEDSFAKSVAVAKEIAEKLAGQPSTPPPLVFNRASRGRIRPNLPAPTAVLRKTATMGKPAPLNTFLSIRPQNTSSVGPPPATFGLFPIPFTKAPNDQNALLGGEPRPPVGRPRPFETMPSSAAFTPVPSEAEPLPPGSTDAPVVVKPAPPVSKPVPVDSKSVLSETLSPLPEAKPASSETTYASSTAKLAPIVVKPDPPVSEPAPIASKPVLSEAKPSTSETPSALSTNKSAPPTMIRIVSDVAAPGVPESEQTRTVFVKPPPLMTAGDRAQNSDKLKSNLAAAKAQDLFGIFYSSIGQSGTSSMTKLAKDTRTGGKSNNDSQLSTPQAQKTQPEHQPCSQSQPSAEVCTSFQTDPNNSPSHQTRPESDIQIASVWSLQSTPAPEVTPSETAPQITNLKLNPSVQSEAHSASQNLSSTPKLELRIDPQPEPAELEPTPQTQSQPKLSPPIQTEPQSKPQPNQDPQPPSHSEIQAHAAPEVAPKPSPKIRGKMTQRTQPAPRPVRQTRSQTRYQTRQQQQSQSEPGPEPASGDSDSASLDPKGLDTSDPGSGSHPEEAVTDITPDSLGLPSDMSSLDFGYDFNFE